MSDRRHLTARQDEEGDLGSDRSEMRIGFVASVALHSLILAFLIFGIPYSSTPKPAIEQIVPVDFVTIAEKPAAPKIEPPKPQPPKPPEPPKEVKNEPPAPIPPPPPPPPPPQEVKQPDPPKIEPPKIEPPKPEPPKPVIAETPKVELKKPEPPKPPEPKKVEVKPPPKPEPKKEPPKKDEFASVEQMLKSLNKPAQPAPQLTPPQPKAVQPPPPPPQTALNYAQQITGSEIAAVQEQMKPCWNPNFGGRNAQDLVVEVEVWANPDGTIMKAQPRQNLRMASDPFYQSAAAAATRAVLNPTCAGIGAKPLPFPREKYEQWKFFVLVFDPKAMLGM